ncbi:MAG: hypothetical protein U0798_11790 [Gemmataceae bacterium]
MKRIFLKLATVTAFLSGSSSFAQPPNDKKATPPAKDNDFSGLTAYLEKAYSKNQQPESVKMLLAVLNGSKMGPGDGWFGPSQSRYSWEWLVKQQGDEAVKGITAAQFRGPKDIFALLDRNHDGILKAEDFDWSDRSPYIRQLRQAQQWLAQADTDGNRRLSKAEWDAIFQKASQGKGYLTAENVLAILNPMPPTPAPSPSSTSTPKSSEQPTKEVLLKGLLNGELGSPCEGPRLGDSAPDFTLASPDGRNHVTLSKLIGPKPVVLIFGSFT